jgi:phosphate transport system substrate-binding protein
VNFQTTLNADVKVRPTNRISRFLKSKLWGIAAAATIMGAMGASSASAQTLTGAGATFPYPLYAKWFDAYKKATGVSINYQAIGSGGGIKQLKAGTVDFGASDAPVSNAELKEFRGRVIHIPTTAGAVCLAYNLPGVGKGLRLDGNVIAGIYLGQITRWNDARITKLNSGKRLPNLPIVTAHRSDSSGTSNIFTSYLSAVNSTWRTRVGTGKSVNWPVGLGGKGNAGVAGVIRQTPGAIGYVELAYVMQNHLSYAALKNRSGKFIMPSIAATTAAGKGFLGAMKKDIRTSTVNAPGATSYPIAAYTYILVYADKMNTPTGKQINRFLRWAMTTGQQYAPGLLYAPLPKEVVQLNLTHLK